MILITKFDIIDWFPKPNPSTLTEETEVRAMPEEPMDNKSDHEKPTPAESRFASYREKSRKHPWKQLYTPPPTVDSDFGPSLKCELRKGMSSPSYQRINTKFNIIARVVEVRPGTPAVPAKPVRTTGIGSNFLRKCYSASFPNRTRSVGQASVSPEVTPAKRPVTPSRPIKDNNVIDNMGSPMARNRGSRPVYENRKDLARRMGLDPRRSAEIRCRRKFVSSSCGRLGYALEQPFSAWDPDEMEVVVDFVTSDMKREFDDHWSADLTRDIIHSISLDAVRNKNARKRRKTNKDSLQWTLNIDGLLPSANTAEVVDSKPVPTIVPCNRSNVLSSGPDAASIASQDAPRATPTDISMWNNNSNVLLTTTPHYSPAGPSYRNSSSMDLALYIDPSESNTIIPSTCRVLPRRASWIAVYTANNIPFYAPTNAGFDRFLRSVVHTLTWTENECLFYCPAGIEPVVWMPVRTESQFSRMFTTCCHGVFLKIEPDNWTDPEVCMYIILNPTILTGGRVLGWVLFVWILKPSCDNLAVCEWPEEGER